VVGGLWVAGPVRVVGGVGEVSWVGLGWWESVGAAWLVCDPLVGGGSSGIRIDQTACDVMWIGPADG
jgi:hypothetical protein